MIRNYFLAGLVAALCFAAVVFTSGGTLDTFADIPSIIIMVIFPLAYQWMLFGASYGKDAFISPFKAEASLAQLSRARLFFKSYRKVAWITALIVVIIGFVTIMKYLEVKEMLGPNLAIASISLLYAGLIDIFIIIPYNIILTKRMAVLEEDI
ncbi:MAG: hypothetical protein LBP19_00750 [Treponema sp.]|jgi:flagellar motor component MotA|nr:hypothetical protein [Treponema sp.]